MKIALLGAESTGKTQLALELAAALRARGLPVAHIGEYLREWCVREGRTPRRDEQQSIAHEQARRAAAAPAGHWVVSDTTSLMVAVYSEQVFGDTSVYPFALAEQRGYDLTLVMGLDLPWVADDGIRDGPHAREPSDTLLRAALTGAGLPFRVIYGQGAQRLASALAAVQGSEATYPSLRNWSCDKCSDPECEHRLFSRLTL